LPGRNSDSDGYSNAHGDGYVNGNCYCDSDGNVNSDSNTDANVLNLLDPVADTDSNGYCHCGAEIYADAEVASYASPTPIRSSV